MPDAESYPRRLRVTVRGAVTLIYLILAAVAAHAVVQAPSEVVRVVGLNATVIVAAVTALAALLGGLAHAAHMWLVERAVILFSLTGVGVFDAFLWAGVYHGHADVDVAALVAIAALALVVRFGQLEMFSHDGRRARRARPRR